MLLKSLLTVGVLILAAVLGAGCARAGIPNVTEVTLNVTESGCSPSGFDTRQGNIIRIALQNSGPTEVSFVYADGPYTFTAAPGQTAQGSFTAPTVPGSYSYLCGTTGAANMTTGEMRVQ